VQECSRSPQWRHWSVWGWPIASKGNSDHVYPDAQAEHLLRGDGDGDCNSDQRLASSACVVMTPPQSSAGCGAWD